MNLRTVLRRFYPGYIVPSLPRNAPHEFTKEILERYKVEIQKFLNELFSHPLFKDSEILSHFILEKSYHAYEKAKNEICKKNLPNSVAQCYTVAGQAKVSFDPLLEERCSELSYNLGLLRKNFRK